MKKGYQGDELWTAVNPVTGKRELVDPEGEFIPGETIGWKVQSTQIAFCGFGNALLSNH
jgi:hypothetical protein